MTPVSVLMTAFNGGHYVKEAVQSLIAQNHNMWELILIDNGSTDGSIDESLSSDGRVRVTRLEANIGRTPALQLALSQARHPYVAILDADDVALPDRFRSQAVILDNNPEIVLVGSSVELVDEHTKPVGRLLLAIGTISHDQIAERNVFVNSSVMYRRESAERVGGYDSQFEFAQDYHLFIRLATTGKCLIVGEPLTQLRMLHSSYTRQSHMEIVRSSDEAALFNFAAEVLTLSGRGKRLNCRRRAIATMNLGITEIRKGALTGGVKNFVRGFLTDKRFSWIPYLVLGRRSTNLNIYSS